MRFLVLSFIACVPLLVYGYESVVKVPQDQRSVFVIKNVKNSQEFFGHLSSFPHTYEFEVTEDTPFKSVIQIPDEGFRQNDVSIIIVKTERRGVSEIGRSNPKTVSWERVRHRMYAESFKDGGSLEGTLTPGRYLLEVSSPNNDALYRLIWGTDAISYGYLGNIRALIEVKAFLGHSRFGAILSPLVYVPLVLVLGVVGFFYYRKRKQKLV
jgi:hypothetical protein